MSVILLDVAVVTRAANAKSSRTLGGQDGLDKEIKDFRKISETRFRALGPPLGLLHEVIFSNDLAIVGPILDLLARSVREARGNIGRSLFLRKEIGMLRELKGRLDGLESGGLSIAPDNGRKEIHEWGIWLLENLPHSGSLFATSVVSSGFWENTHGSAYHQLNIEAAREKKCSIVRVFIIEDGDAFSAARAQITIEEQQKAGIDVRYIFDSELPTDRRKDFGIWDNKLVCYNEPECAEYFTSDSELVQAKKLRDRILRAARPYNQEKMIFPKDHPMFRSAAILGDAERRFKGERPCRWYHESWGYLRSLGLVEQPRTHEEFFARYLREVVRGSTKGLDILICGLADHEMFAVVEEAIESDSRDDVRDRHKVTVLDPCPAPLETVKWYFSEYLSSSAKAGPFVRKLSRTRPPPRIVEAKIQESGLPAESFDLVVTDCLITKLLPDDQIRVVAEWRRLLRPDSYAITTLRSGPESNPSEGIGADPDQVRAYVKRARQAFDALTNNELPIGAETLEEFTRKYTEENISYPVAFSELDTLFSGFSIEERQEITVSPEYGELKNVRVYARRR